MTSVETDVQSCLKTLTDPNTGKDFVTGKSVKKVAVTDGEVHVDIELGYPAVSQFDVIQEHIENALKQVAGVDKVRVHVRQRIIAHVAQQGLKLLPGVKNVIAVASGKGGVGKSTTAVNLALALVAEGAKVGMLDADVYGPSLPTMLGANGLPQSEDGETIEPLEAHGMQVMSIGFMIDVDTPMVWRGPMATQALDQLLRQTKWNDLDYLVVDMPPGTGDIQLTLAQKVPVTGAVIVTTPQDIALIDARKGYKMFEKVGIPVVGIVENMSVHTCSNCGHTERIFGEGGAARMGADYQLPVLGALPLDLHIREQADSGQPTVVSDPESKAATLYKEIARKTAVAIARKAVDFSSKFPNIVVKNS
ncbi:MAG: iron-sulfur cluster carrier protein ApbC [Burkholderiales bacterium]|jgi:ATP-binding protein involved in chromosome partitioning|nr:iron-sulfur cluster carrier protein ApbC [Burkholderiales bacterium]